MAPMSVDSMQRFIDSPSFRDWSTSVCSGKINSTRQEAELYANIANMPTLRFASRAEVPYICVNFGLI